MRLRCAAFRPSMCVLAALFLVALPSFAQAQEGEVSPADTSTGWIFRWVNFVIVFALIAWGFVKAAPAFRANSEEISRKIAEGARARERAEQQRREAQAKLAGIADEIAHLKAEAQRGAAAEAQRIRALARDEAQKIERAGQAEIAAAERAARLQLKALAARLAIEQAESVLRGEVTPKADQLLFQSFVGQLAGSAN